MSTTFSVWDYVVFSLVLVISIAIGFYHALVGGKQQTTAEFLLADRSLSALPVALSVLASFFSASTLLGTPAEIYLRGTQYWMSVWGAMVAPLVGAFIFGPFLHRLKLVSVFQYLEMRYQSKAARTFGAVLFIIRATLGMGIVLFGPAVALNAVTGFPTWAVIILIGAVCIVYTTLGGMKAVIWTDVFQTFIMLAGMLAVVIQGTIAVGGLGKVWAIAEAGGRIQFFDFDPDPTVRHTFWTLVVGSLFVWMPPYTIDQQMIQRFSSTRSLQQAVWALLLNIPGMFVIITLCSLSGLVMYAYYADCDPIDRGTVHDPNQLLPRFVMDVLGFVPGLPGLFVASLFSGAFSSMSSMLNSLAAVTWEDFLKLSPKMRRLPDKQATYVNKGLVVVFAVLGVAMAFVFSLVGGTVLQMSMAFNGAAGAPLVGIFLLGVFFPCANWIGVVVGGALGCALPMWISVGAYVTKPPVMRNLPRSIAGCLNSSDVTTASLLSTVVSTLEPFTSEPMTLAPSSSDDTLPLYTLSYLWYTATGIVVTLTVGLAVSVLTNRFVAVSVEPGLMISFVDRFCCCFPLTWRERTRCGIQLLKHEKGAETSEESTGPGSGGGINTKL